MSEPTDSVDALLVEFMDLRERTKGFVVIADEIVALADDTCRRDPLTYVDVLEQLLDLTRVFVANYLRPY